MIEHKGWGPCTHTPEESEKVIKWLNELMPESDVSCTHGGKLETLLWELNLLGAFVKLGCDQWTGCWAEGTLLGTEQEIKTFIQGDTFLISVGETYRWWKEKYKELTGKDYS